MLNITGLKEGKGVGVSFIGDFSTSQSVEIFQPVSQWRFFNQLVSGDFSTSQSVEIFQPVSQK